MKRIVALGVTLALVVACGGSSGPAAPAVGASAAPAAASAVAAKPRVELKIGMVLPYSGTGAHFGEVQDQGVALALDELNTNGGVNGHITFAAVREDSKAQGDPAAAAMQKLTSIDKAVAVMTSFSTPPMAMGPAADRSKTPLFAIGGASPKFAKAFEYLFATQINHLVTLDVLGAWIQKNRPQVKKIALYLDSGDLGRGDSDFVRKNWPSKYGLQIVGEEIPDTAQTEHAAQIAKLRAMNADATLVMLTGGAPMGSFIKQARDLGLKNDILCAAECKDPQTQKVAVAAMENTFFATEYVDFKVQTPEMLDFIKRFTAKFNKAPDDPYQTTGYDTMKVVVAAIKAADAGNKPLTGETVRAFIKDTKCFTGAIGRLCFRDDQLVDKATAVNTYRGGGTVVLEIVKP